MCQLQNLFLFKTLVKKVFYQKFYILHRIFLRKKFDIKNTKNVQAFITRTHKHETQLINVKAYHFLRVINWANHC